MEEMEKLSDTLLRVSGQGDTRNLLQPHLDVHQDLLQDRTRGEETDVRRQVDVVVKNQDDVSPMNLRVGLKKTR